MLAGLKSTFASAYRQSIAFYLELEERAPPALRLFCRILIAAVLIGLFVWSPAQAVGIIGAIILIIAGYLEFNSERNAAASAGGAVYIVHLLLLGTGFERLVQVALFSIRSLLMAMLATREDSHALRIISGAIFIVFGWALMAWHGFGGWLTYMPLLTMILGVISSAMPDSRSHLARFIGFLATPPLLLYDIFVTFSIGGIILETAGGLIVLAAIFRYDTSGKDFKTYFKSLLSRQFA